MFSKQLPLADVIDLCRTLRHNLGAGITLRKVFSQQAERGPRGLRALAARVGLAIEQGARFTEALQKEKEYLPHLLLSLAKVGEETGHLPEIFGELERYYILQQKLRRQLRTQSLLPLIQLGLAFLIIAGLILVLGLIAASRGSTPITVFGLSGPAGAGLFLLLSFGFCFLVWLSYKLLTRFAEQKAAVDALLLKVHALGPCLEAFALGRFCLAMHLTLDSGMSITKALRLSLEATGNAAFAAQAPLVAQTLKSGETLLEALTRTRLFSVEFLNIVAVGEEGGRVPEVMRHQADYYHEEASRRLTTLTRLAGLGVWLIYAIFMVWAIFKIAGVYLGALGV